MVCCQSILFFSSECFLVKTNTKLKYCMIRHVLAPERQTGPNAQHTQNISTNVRVVTPLGVNQHEIEQHTKYASDATKVVPNRTRTSLVQ